ncbi:MAG: hypothetical protein RSE12_08400 [Fuscovulum sp.]|nr:MAG: hypothetical protein RSE12_08400 [Fuscovulum sp.]
MTVRRFLRTGTPYLLCAAVLAGAAIEFFKEYSLVFFLRGTTNQQIEQLAAIEEALPLPASSKTSRDLLVTCAKVVLEAPLLKADEKLNRLVRFNCARFARSVLSSAPLSGRARATLLLMERTVDDAVQLAMAQTTAPNEPVPLQIRLAAYTSYGSPPSTTRELIVRDFERAAETWWGRQAVARIYVSVPAFRDVIVEAGRNLKAEKQADLVKVVRRAAGEQN